MKATEDQGLALEVEASEGLSVADVVDRAAGIHAPFAIVLEQGAPVGVLAVEGLTPSPMPAVDPARAAPAVVPRMVTIGLPGGETLDVNVNVQGDEFAVWDRGHEHLVVSLAGRDVASALTNRVMAFAASDFELPGPRPPLEPRYHTYVCVNRHYQPLASDDTNKQCRKCGRTLYRI